MPTNQYELIWAYRNKDDNIGIVRPSDESIKFVIPQKCSFDIETCVVRDHTCQRECLSESKAFRYMDPSVLDTVSNKQVVQIGGRLIELAIESNEA